GGMIVMDESTCMVDLARYFLTFTQDESCGSCFSCREGITRMMEIVGNICRGKSSLEELELLKELAEVVKDSTLCGLGQTCANPVLSTIRYFEDEYRAHILEKRCPAGVCRELISFRINEDLCNGCGACLKKCPVEAIEGEKKEPHTILQDRCTRCGICLETCKYDAVIKE
ncbi:MAG: NADH-quinone oxidoreductase subunit F, partial [Firmicutes bacterium HGW-Firmicutes-13]